MTMLGMSKVSTKFQATIPADVRKAFDIKVGDKLVFKNEDGKLMIEKA